MTMTDNPTIINLTSHAITRDQADAGVVEPIVWHYKYVVELLTFDDIPSPDEIRDRARSLAEVADDELREHRLTKRSERFAMIGGAGFLMWPLEEALREKNIVPLWAFSKKVSEDRVMADGRVEKVSIFKHLGFVGVPEG